ncbi:class I SAM-dependent methyltransferase [Paenibacillus flagellatus]|uniref:Phospholipid methyltransferase n=1 Tax=Paenibacillus flagellatus TaxID=2211139 RepID=A0A2V5KAR8_9BACL|nr:rRNA adenine N-6-methyltransferase family protein [Paenibacillus flagellatus]PYI56558.1 phospholipid methyltransferase [Paenibacillus flagellatus]
MIKTIREKLLFLYKFSQAPKQMGSVTPSSVYLAQKMVESIDWSETEAVAELGAGTGAITKHIGSSMREGTKLLVFEKDPSLRGILQERFPAYSFHPDAGKLGLAMRSEGVERLDCVLSGLPFFNFPQALRDRLMNEVESALKPGGLFVAFQYSQQMRKQLAERFDIERVHFVPFNIPPAFVYVCRKKEEEVGKE